MKTFISSPSTIPPIQTAESSEQQSRKVKICADAAVVAVSICVCTYRRPHLLAMLLNSLAEQCFYEPFEIIVVDNDPAGGATEAIETARKCHPELKIRYAVEPRKGISFARNTAAALAAGEFVAWIDDDETATRHWLTLLWTTRSAINADAVFGPVVPTFPQGSRSWSRRSGIFERPRHPTGTIIDAREARTGNALVKTSWLRTLAPPFDVKLANTGGEDYDFFARIAKNGARFAWCDEAEVFEMVPFERQRLTWVLERGLRGSTNYWRNRSTSGVRGVPQALLGGIAFLVLCVGGIIAAPFGFHHTVKFWRRAMGGLGRIVALSGLQWKGY